MFPGIFLALHRGMFPALLTLDIGRGTFYNCYQNYPETQAAPMYPVTLREWRKMRLRL